MIKTFDCFMLADRNPEFKIALENALGSGRDEELYFQDTHRLIFDSNSKTVVVKPCADDSPYACKIVPAKISYSAVEKMLSGKLDDFVEENIQYIL